MNFEMQLASMEVHTLFKKQNGKKFYLIELEIINKMKPILLVLIANHNFNSTKLPGKNNSEVRGEV